MAMAMGMGIRMGSDAQASEKAKDEKILQLEGALEEAKESLESSLKLLNERLSKKEEEAFDGIYRFEASEAWWLDRNEIRQALPIKELGR